MVASVPKNDHMVKRRRKFRPKLIKFLPAFFSVIFPTDNGSSESQNKILDEIFSIFKQTDEH